MADATFLNGKVHKYTLPVLQGGGGVPMPPRKRLALAQGDLAEIHDGEEEIRYLAVIELRAGCMRGNHFHKVKKEFLYVIEGELLVEVQNPQTGDAGFFQLEAGELAIIPPGIIHVLKTVRPGKAIEFSPARFNPADTFKA